jgi:hypothetical protein
MATIKISLNECCQCTHELELPDHQSHITSRKDYDPRRDHVRACRFRRKLLPPACWVFNRPRPARSSATTKETRTNNCFDFLPGNREQSRGERQQAIQLFLRVS